MTKLEDLKGRTIIDVRVMPYMPPEEFGQLELVLDDGSVLGFNLERQDGKEQGDYAVAKVNGREIYRA